MQDALSQTFAALSDPTRRQILAQLARGEASVNQLAEPFDISLPAISRHLKVLEAARLIERRRDAQFRLCRLRADPLQEASTWLERYAEFWNAKLDSLAAFVEREPKDDADD